MRTKGSANKVRFGRTATEVKDSFIKFRCSSSFKKLVEDYRALHPGYIARGSEGEMIRRYILEGMMRNGPWKGEEFNTRLQEQLDKH